MPQMDGVELTRRVRTMDGHRRTPIIMITAMSDKSYIDNAFQAGANDYVTKPFDVVDLHSRLKLAERRIEKAKSGASKIFVSSRSAHELEANRDQINLLSPISIFDVDGLIDLDSMENYVAQLTRSAQYGSGVFALNIRRIADLHAKCTKLDFEGLIADTAEAISDCMAGTQFLLSYAGNGTYICVVEGGFRPDMSYLVDQINLHIHHMGLAFSSGEEMRVRLAAGDFIRLIWRDSKGAREALGKAHVSAEEASERVEKAQDDFWYLSAANAS
jgi:CheY-like chemotaxis protein